LKKVELIGTDIINLNARQQTSSKFGRVTYLLVDWEKNKYELDFNGKKTHFSP